MRGISATCPPSLFVIPEGARQRPAPEPTRRSVTAPMPPGASIPPPSWSISEHPREGQGSGGMDTGTAIDGSSDIEGDISRSEEHTSELQSLMRISYAVF